MLVCSAQVVSGAVLILVAQLPSMSHAQIITLMMTLFLIAYSIASAALSFVFGARHGAALVGRGGQVEDQ